MLIPYFESDVLSGRVVDTCVLVRPRVQLDEHVADVDQSWINLRCNVIWTVIDLCEGVGLRNLDFIVADRGVIHRLPEELDARLLAVSCLEVAEPLLVDDLNEVEFGPVQVLVYDGELLEILISRAAACSFPFACELIVLFP